MFFCSFESRLCTTHAETSWGSSTSFPTTEMKSRGDLKRLWVGVLIALPSGAGVALSILGGNTGKQSKATWNYASLVLLS